MTSLLIPDWFVGVSFSENTVDYFILGTFGAVDLIAITLGTGIAYFVLLAPNIRRKIA